jgi:hypothetical protein
MLFNKKMVSAVAALGLLSVFPISAEDGSVEALRKEIQEMKKNQAAEKELHQKEIQELKAKVNEMRVDRGERPKASKTEKFNDHKDLSDNSMNYRSDGMLKAGGLKLGAYGETRLTMQRRNDAVIDPHRLVLLPSYQINDYLIFNSEIEFEHGGVDDTDGVKSESNTSTSRFDGEVEIEQMYVDWLINEHFNVRSLGIDVIPVGRINMYHEPTYFYSADRPELYTNIIPSTWMEAGLGFFGKITDEVDYRLMISQGLEESNTSGGVTATGIRNARPAMRRAANSVFGYSGRVAYTPGWLQGFQGSTSFYYTDIARNSGPGAAGQNNRSVDMFLWDIEFVYRIPKTPLELRADYAHIFFDGHEGLLANLPSTGGGVPASTAAVGPEMYGWYVELAAHLWPESWKKGRWKEMDFVPFARFTQTNTQTGDFDLPANPTGANFHDIYTFGFAYFPASEFVLKLDYQIDDNNQPNSTDINQLRAAAGFFF